MKNNLIITRINEKDANVISKLKMFCYPWNKKFKKRKHLWRFDTLLLLKLWGVSRTFASFSNKNNVNRSKKDFTLSLSLSLPISRIVSKEEYACIFFSKRVFRLSATYGGGGDVSRHRKRGGPNTFRARKRCQITFKRERRNGWSSEGR